MKSLLMMHVNLIPAHRRDARERRTRVRRWAAVCCIYALLLGVTYLCCALAWNVGSDGLDEELAAAALEMQELERSLEGAEAELSQAQSLLDSIRGIAKQPDWSLLLALVSRTLGEEVVLDTCRLAPPSENGSGVRTRNVLRAARAAGTAAAAPARTEPPYMLYISGYAQSQEAVSRFVLRLDELDLFERVEYRTSREMIFDRNATGFQVQCSFRWQPRRKTP